jgi:LPXTG-motif cell wall-anchored protein
MPVPPQEPLPKTGDSKTIVVIALVVLILAGGAVLWLRKRGKDEEPAESEELS